MNPILTKSCLEIRELIVSKKIAIKEILDITFEHIEKYEPLINAFISINKEQAYKTADILQNKLESNNKIGSLFGIPIAIKDNICTKGIKTTCASKYLENFVPPYDATVIERIKEEDGIIIGKTNMDEFAMGSSTERSAFKNTRNPWNLECVPGGSSGGSAACVASRFAPAALGSDTGGSIRQPASFCSIAGLKPTYGLVSRYGLVAFASSLDQIGPMAHNVKDIALLLNIISGNDSRDSTSIKFNKPDYLQGLNKKIEGIKIGLPREYFSDKVNPEILEKVATAAKIFEKFGFKLQDIQLPHTDYVIATYYLIAAPEASSNLARYDGIHYGYRAEDFQNIRELYIKTRTKSLGEEVKRRILLGTFALSSGYYDDFYLKALKVRRKIAQDFEDAFKKVDVIISPVSPVLPFRLGERIADPMQQYLCDILTCACNLAGIPGIAIPCGFSKNNLPIGMQIMGPPLSEEVLLQTAYLYEQETGFNKIVPPLIQQ